MSLRFAHLTTIALLFGLSVAAASPAAAQEASADTVQIVGFGDSLMAGYQLAQSDGFTAQLQSALQNAGYKASVANAGVSGDTTSGGLARLDWSVPDETQLVILELGANDALRGISPELSEKNLDQMLARLKERGIPVLLAGMIAPPNMGADYAAGFNPIYQTLADKYQIKLYPFFLDGVAADKKLLLDDGMHPTPQGVKVMVANILAAVKAMLDQESIDLN